MVTGDEYLMRVLVMIAKARKEKKPQMSRRIKSNIYKTNYNNGMMQLMI